MAPFTARGGRGGPGGGRGGGAPRGGRGGFSGRGSANGVRGRGMLLVLSCHLRLNFFGG